MKIFLKNTVVWVVCSIVVGSAILFFRFNNVYAPAVIAEKPLVNIPIHKKVEQSESENRVAVRGAIANTTLTIVVGNTNTRILFSRGDTLYTVLSNAQKAHLISFSGIQYPSLGFLVTGIGDLHQGGGKFLIYYINKKEATMGISSYTPNDGDTIEWKLQ